MKKRKIKIKKNFLVIDVCFQISTTLKVHVQWYAISSTIFSIYTRGTWERPVVEHVSKQEKDGKRSLVIVSRGITIGGTSRGLHTLCPRYPILPLVSIFSSLTRTHTHTHTHGRFSVIPTTRVDTEKRRWRRRPWTKI